MIVIETGLVPSPPKTVIVIAHWGKEKCLNTLPISFIVWQTQSIYMGNIWSLESFSSIYIHD